MDVKLEKRPITHLFAKGVIGLAIVIFAVLCLWLYKLVTAEKTTLLPSAKVTLHRVQRSAFTDTMVTRAVAIPYESVIIASERGGKVTAINQYPANVVKKGDVIARLSNYDFVLQVTSRIASATEQINNLRNMRRLLEKDNLDTQLAEQDTRYHFQKTDKEMKRNKALYDRGILEKATYENLQDELAYWEKKYAILTAYQAQQDKMMPVQLAEIESSVQHLDTLTHLVEGGLEQLVITSPIDGILSPLEIKIGQQIKPGERVANVDNQHAYYFEASFSEYYLDKIKPQSQVIAQYAGTEIPLIIESVSSNVDNGKFVAKLALVHPQSLSLKRGQSIDLQVSLGTAQKVLLIPSEAIFFQDGQALVYLYDENKRRAVRTPVEIKRQGAAQSEVISGLAEGQQVVTFTDNNIEKSNIIELE